VLLVLLGAPAMGSAAKVPRRVVSMAPSLTDIAVDLGAGDLLVGVSRFDDAPRFKGLPRVGGYVDPDVEGVVRLHPDLVLALDGVAYRATLEALRAAGVTVRAVRDDSLLELQGAIVEIAAALGVPAEGTRLNASLEATVERVRRESRGHPQVRVAIAVGYRPLVLAGRGSYLEALIEAAGGANVVQSLLPWPMSSFEALFQRPPAVLIDGAPLEQDESAKRMLRLLAEGGTRVVRLPDQDLFRAGPRAVAALPSLAKALRGP